MAEKVTIYHNPRCSKSRQTLALLREHGIEPEVVEYLKSPPSAGQLDRILKRLGLDPRQAMRRNESPYRELKLDREDLSRADLIDAMVASPILMQRPIVVRGPRAAIGRPPQNVLAILE